MRVWANFCAKFEISLQTQENILSIISNLAYRNSLKLAQIIRLIAILLSREFQENRILGSTDICLGTTPNHIFGDIFLCF